MRLLCPGVLGTSLLQSLTVSHSCAKGFGSEKILEDGDAGSTRNLSPHLDSNCRAVSLTELFWNPEGFQLQGEASDRTWASPSALSPVAAARPPPGRLAERTVSRNNPILRGWGIWTLIVYHQGADRGGGSHSCSPCPLLQPLSPSQVRI